MNVLVLVHIILWIYMFNYNLVATEFLCTQTIQHNSSVLAILSPNYPRPYSPGSRCIYHIIHSEGYRILITFSSFILESPDSKTGLCSYDQFSISLADQKTSICGDQSDFLDSLEIVADESVEIHFQSDYSNEFSGFQMNIEYRPDSSSLDLYHTYHLQQPSGVIHSPNYIYGSPTFPTNTELSIALNSEQFTCVNISLTFGKSIIPGAVQTRSSSQAPSVSETPRTPVTLTYPCLLSVTHASPEGGVTSTCIEQVPEGTVLLHILDNSVQIEARLGLRLPFSMDYTLFESDACSDALGFVPEFSLAQVGLWFLVSLSSIGIILFFTVQGCVKHCRENKICCYNVSKKTADSRRSSFVGTTAPNTPKSTRTGPKPSVEVPRISIDASGQRISPYVNGVLVHAASSDSLAPHNNNNDSPTPNKTSPIKSLLGLPESSSSTSAAAAADNSAAAASKKVSEGHLLLTLINYAQKEGRVNKGYSPDKDEVLLTPPKALPVSNSARELRVYEGKDVRKDQKSSSLPHRKNTVAPKNHDLNHKNHITANS